MLLPFEQGIPEGTGSLLGGLSERMSFARHLIKLYKVYSRPAQSPVLLLSKPGYATVALMVQRESLFYKLLVVFLFLTVRPIAETSFWRTA